MASKSTFTRMQRLQKTVDKYAAERKRLKDEGDYVGLARLPRDASPTRIRRMCALTGRTRGTYRKLGISRLMLRKLAHEGKIPGMKKSSW